MAEDFRRATRDLVQIGTELAFIAGCLDDIQVAHRVPVRTALFKAREASRSAGRLAARFKYVAYILQGLAEQEVE